MTQAQGKKGLITTIVVLGLTLLVVGGIVIWQNVTRSTPASDTSSEVTPPAEEETATDTPSTSENDPDTTTSPAVDPSTLSSIDIEPLEITVFYTKGTGAFEFAVLRTSDGTRYVEFSNSELIGTKCSSDTGVFATIIKSPEDTSIIAETVVVDGVTYGLSLATETCTANPDLLKQYQSGFRNGFSQLKAMSS